MSKRDRENEKYIRDVVRSQIQSEPMSDERFMRLVQARHQQIALEENKPKRGFFRWAKNTRLKRQHEGFELVKTKRNFLKPALISCLSVVLVVMITLMSVYLPQSNGGGGHIIDGGNTGEPTMEPTPRPHFAEDDLDRIRISAKEIKKYYSNNIIIENFNIKESYLLQSKSGAVPCYLAITYANLFEKINLYIVLTDMYTLEEYYIDFRLCNQLMNVNALTVLYNTKINDIYENISAKFDWKDCKYYFKMSYLYAEGINRIETVVKQLIA